MNEQMTGYPSIDKPWLKYYKEDAINTETPKGSLFDYMYDCNKDYPDQIALNYFDTTMTYGDFFIAIDKAAHAFKNIGVKVGDIVTFSALACPETIIALYALNKIGAIPNMINVLSSSDEYKDYIIEVESKYFVCWSVFFDKAKSIIDDTNVSKVIIIDPFNYLPFFKRTIAKLKSKDTIAYSDKIIKWNIFISAVGKDVKEIETVNNDIAVIAHTGGTTGTPKGVLISNRAINSVALQYDKITEHSRQEIYLDLIVPFVIYGIAVNIHMPLCMGLTLVMIPFFKPEEVPGFFMHYKPNISVSVPSYWTPFLQNEKMKGKDLSFLRIAGAGGDGMTPEIERDVNEFLDTHGSRARMLNGYGLTETCSNGISSFDGIIKSGSVGIPFPKVIVKVVNPDTYEELTYNQEGEVCINTDCMMNEYYKNAEATKDIIRTHNDGMKWVHTGDLGHIDEDGFVFLTGRMRRIILTSYTAIPSKIFPDRIESVIMEHPAVFQCCVISIPHEKYAHVTEAHIVLKNEYKDSAGLILKEIQEKCKDELPDYSVPFSYKYKESLPLTAVGKVDWRLLEEEAERMCNM